MLAAYIDEIIILCVGAWATAVGFGYVAAPAKDAASQQLWQARFGKLFRIIGPLLLVVSLALAVATFLGLSS